MLLERLAEVLNRNIGESRKAQVLCRQLDGRVVSLTVEGTPFAFFFTAEGGRVALSTRHDGDADASLSGTPIALLALAGPRAEGALKFRELLAQAQPDFEEELARVIGDVAARQVANFARGFLDWGRKAGGSLSTNVVEYLQEEGRDLPTRTETEEFLADVDRLRDDTERLEARLARLESRTAAAVPKRPRKQAE
jgi:ubiquinone biosynthesis protein UbiJ